MLENRMVIDSEWRNLEREKLSGLENLVSQSEHAGIDVFGNEILEGDSIVIDCENSDEIILQEDLKRYLIEAYNFVFIADYVCDKSRNALVKECILEEYLVKYYNFKFTQAE